MKPSTNRGMTYRTPEQVRILHDSLLANIMAEIPLKSVHENTGVGNDYARRLIHDFGYRLILISREEFAEVRKMRKNGVGRAA